MVEKAARVAGDNVVNRVATVVPGATETTVSLTLREALAAMAAPVAMAEWAEWAASEEPAGVAAPWSFA